MPEDPLRHLSREECLRLLDHERLGRVAVSVGALPAILPVNYSVSEGVIVLRTGPGTKLSAALMNAVVGFEIDSSDAHHASGWSVLVVGQASEVQDDATLERLRRLPLESWAPDDGDHFVAISIEQVTGRAFGRVRALDSALGTQPAASE